MRPFYSNGFMEFKCSRADVFKYITIEREQSGQSVVAYKRKGWQLEHSRCHERQQLNLESRFPGIKHNTERIYAYNLLSSYDMFVRLFFVLFVFFSNE